jgi:uncharacterized protein (DUF983 family)
MNLIKAIIIFGLVINFAVFAAKIYYKQYLWASLNLAFFVLFILQLYSL